MDALGLSEGAYLDIIEGNAARVLDMVLGIQRKLLEGFDEGECPTYL